MFDYDGATMFALRRFAPAATISVAIALNAGQASAQVHWDASAHVGVMKRILTDRPGDDAGFGPAGQLAAHVALLPLLRVGGYFGHDISPAPGDAAARHVTWGGVRAKIMSPWQRSGVRPYFFAGFGYAGVYGPSYTTRIALHAGVADTVSKNALVTGAGGSFFEVPLGIGVSYKLRGALELGLELGGRIGFGFVGSLYEPPGRAFFAEGVGENRLGPVGLDRFAVSLLGGVLFDL